MITTTTNQCAVCGEDLQHDGRFCSSQCTLEHQYSTKQHDHCGHIDCSTCEEDCDPEENIEPLFENVHEEED